MAEYTWNGSAWRLVAEDTGWVTAGIDITPGTGITITQYNLRRKNGRVVGYVGCTSSSAITLDAVGNVSDFTLFTLPSGWAANNQNLTRSQWGYNNDAPKLHLRINASVTVAGGFPNATIAAGSLIVAVLDFDLG